MDGKVIVVTGALGALGRVVVDEALARGARIASVDHAPTQAPATADLFELGGVDLTDAAHARKAIDAAAAHFGKLDALTTRQNFEREAIGYQTQSMNFNASAAQAGSRASAATYGMGASVFSTALGGVSDYMKTRDMRL